jgi:hypothetical protein
MPEHSLGCTIGEVEYPGTPRSATGAKRSLVLPPASRAGGAEAGAERRKRAACFDQTMRGSPPDRSALSASRDREGASFPVSLILDRGFTVITVKLEFCIFLHRQNAGKALVSTSPRYLSLDRPLALAVVTWRAKWVSTNPRQKIGKALHIARLRKKMVDRGRITAYIRFWPADAFASKLP